MISEGWFWVATCDWCGRGTGDECQPLEDSREDAMREIIDRDWSILADGRMLCLSCVDRAVWKHGCTECGCAPDKPCSGDQDIHDARLVAFLGPIKAAEPEPWGHTLTVTVTTPGPETAEMMDALTDAVSAVLAVHAPDAFMGVAVRSEPVKPYEQGAS